jgi:hypothetical protein
MENSNFSVAGMARLVSQSFAGACMPGRLLEKAHRDCTTVSLSNRINSLAPGAAQSSVQKLYRSTQKLCRFTQKLRS